MPARPKNKHEEQEEIFETCVFNLGDVIEKNDIPAPKKATIVGHLDQMVEDLKDEATRLKNGGAHAQRELGSAGG